MTNTLDKRVMNITPRKTPKMFPWPPDRLQPPSTAAEITVSSAPVPVVEEADPNREAFSTPANPARNPEIMYVIILILSV